MPMSRTGTAYDLTGPEDAPVVVLIHGLGLNRQITWGAIADALAKRFRVLRYDLCGHGQSVVPEGPVNLSVLADQIIDLMDELGVAQAALVGFSLGGMINRRCAIDYPGRVSALAILNSPHERAPEKQAEVERQARDADAGGPGATIDAALLRWFTPESHADHRDLVEAVRDVVLANDPGNYAVHRQVLAEGVVELIRPDPAITHPALMMTCEDDSGQTPAMAWAIAGEMAEADVIIVPGLRHLGLIERPELFAGPVAEFLDKTL